MAAVSARDVAAALRERVPGMTTAKLQKLLYYCQGHHLATFDEPLFRETVSAWDHGPVVGEIWFAENAGAEPGSAANLDEAQLNTVGYVASRYGGMSTGDLIKLTHAEDPWVLTNEGRIPGTSRRIRPELMRDYFRLNSTPDDDEMPTLDSDTVREWLDRAAQERIGRPEGRETTREELLARLAGLARG